MKKRRRTKVTPKVAVTISANNTTYEGRGKTFEEALNSIIPPQKFVTSTSIRVVKDGKIIDRMVQKQRVWKFFHGNPVVREILLKQFNILFKI